MQRRLASRVAAEVHELLVVGDVMSRGFESACNCGDAASKPQEVAVLRRRAAADGLTAASMWPRRRSRGRPCLRHWPWPRKSCFNVAAASMWPRRRSRGRRSHDWVPSAARAFDPASMWPRRRSRGRRADLQALTVATCFNVAAASKPRKTVSSIAAVAACASFNVAAASKPRKTAGSQPIARAARCLGLASATQIRRPRTSRRRRNLINDVK